MASQRIHLSQSSPARPAASRPAPSPVSSALQAHPGAAAAPGPAAAESAPADWAQQLATAERLGHHFDPAPAHSAEPASPVAGDARPSAHQGGETALPGGLRAGVETLSGVSLDDVKVHYGSAEPDRVQALAFTQGSHIHLAPGQEAHLAHEAWHVVQQKQRRVQPTRRLERATLNDDPSLESEADRMGRLAARQAARPGSSRGRRGGPAAGAPGGLRGAHAAAFDALSPAGLGPSAAGGAGAEPVQRVLKGAHAKAAQKIAAYMPDSHEARSAILHEAQDLGYPAPNLPGHRSKKSGADDAGEAERQKQINNKWAAWEEGFQAHKARGGGAAEEPEDDVKEEKKSQPKGGKFTPSKKEERRAAGKQKKKSVYDEYVASLGGGKPTVKGFKAWKAANG